MILLKVTTAKSVWFVVIGFLIMDSSFKISVCNGCNDLTMLYLSISDIAIITVKGVDYCCIIHGISKFERIHLLKNSSLKDSG